MTKNITPSVILVVDDDVGLARLLEKTLGREGFTVVMVNSGKEALTWLAANTADLLLLDLKLPDIGGLELITRLSEMGCPTPFVIITGQGDERVAVELMKSGALDYLIKDAKFMEFIPATVHRVLRQIDKEKQLEREILEISDFEMRRIGCDLHDGLGQHLTALELFATGLLVEVRKQAPKLGKSFEDMTSQLRLVVQQARALSHGLAPISLDSYELMSALRGLAENTRTMTKVACEFVCEPEIQVEDSTTATHLYRIAQEAVNNAIKHSRAKRINISLNKNGPGLELKVTDDGHGITEMKKKDGGMGMSVMQYRANLIRSKLEIASAPEKGTQITCTFRETP